MMTYNFLKPDCAVVQIAKRTTKGRESGFEHIPELNGVLPLLGFLFSARHG